MFERAVQQYVIPVPTNAQALTNVLAAINAHYGDVPLLRVKVTVDEDSLVWSVPVDWRAEDARRTQEST